MPRKVIPCDKRYRGCTQVKRDPLQTATAALEKHYPDTLGAFVGGSSLSGIATTTSDIDIAVLYDDTFNDVHRFSTTQDGWPIEFFVHNIKAQDYYFEKDRLRGMCVMPTLVGTGIIIPKSDHRLKQQQIKAQKIIAAGPPLLTCNEIDLSRYQLTDLIDDLLGVTNSEERHAILVQLYNKAGDFYLRGQGLWSGVGKALIRKLREQRPVYAERFSKAFTEAFQTGVSDAVVTIATEVLDHHGGRLRDGYRSLAPKTWQTFSG